jgi:MSHA biogenesis protein MshK
MRFVIVFAAAQCMTSFAAAQLADPMRPYGYTVPGTPQGIAAPAAAGLQLIKSSKEGKVALIDGQEVRVGQKVGDSRLISLSETSAVLRDAEGKLTTLKMFAEAQKQLLSDKSAMASAPGVKR